MFVMGWLSTQTPASRVVASVPAVFAALRTRSEELLGVSILGKTQFLGQGMKRSPAERRAADLKQLRGTARSAHPGWFLLLFGVAGWYSARLSVLLS